MPDAPPLPEAYCLTCGYRLDTFAEPPRCSECGRAFEPEDPFTLRAPGFEPDRAVRRSIIFVQIWAIALIVLVMFVRDALKQPPTGMAY